MSEGEASYATGETVFDLTDHVAVVTGGSDGIGLGYARGLAKCGARVAIWARDAQRLAAAEEHLRELGSGGVLGFPCDVTSEEQIKAAMKETITRFGRIGSFFANAGKAGAAALLDTHMPAFRTINAVNVEGMLCCFREAARHMIDRGQGGKLIATSSTAAIMGSPRLVAYSAAKGALTAAVRALAVELGPHGIQVNAVVPGMFKTAMTRRVDEETTKRLLSRIPSTFIGEPRHVEGIAVFLASRESDYVTGACIPVDGGLSIAWG